MHPRLRKIVFKDEIELKIGISQSVFTNRVPMTSYPVIKVKNLKKSPIWGLFWIKFKFENDWRSFEVTQTLLYSNFYRLSHANLIRLPIPVCRFVFWYLFGKIVELKMSFEDDPINWFVQKRVIPRRLYYLTPPCVSSGYFSAEEFLKLQNNF